MDVHFTLGADGYSTRVELKPGPYDGTPPVDALTFRMRLRILDPSISAVATAIVAQNLAAESLNYPLPVQSHVADAIERFFSSRRFRVQPAEQVPAAIPAGNRRALLGHGSPVGDGSVGFTLGDASAFTSFASTSCVHVASNVACFFADDERGHAIATLAAATFVAADYGFGSICISSQCASVLGATDLERYRALLDSVNLKIRVENPA